MYVTYEDLRVEMFDLKYISVLFTVLRTSSVRIRNSYIHILYIIFYTVSFDFYVFYLIFIDFHIFPMCTCTYIKYNFRVRTTSKKVVTIVRFHCIKIKLMLC